MQKIRIEKLSPGMVLARSIYATDGRMLVREKTKLSESLLERLKTLGLPAAYIQTMVQSEADEVVSEITRVDLIKSLSKLEKTARFGKKLDLLQSKQPLFALIDEVNRNRSQPLTDFPDIRLRDDYLYGHSVNVCVIAVKLGLKLGYNSLKLAELAVGTLFHDLGMTQIPLNILNKTTPLSEEEIERIKTHPETGYKLLKSNFGVSNVAAHIAYQHHERYDGNGYPRRLTGRKIHEFARIAAIADVFDSMTTEKLYRPAQSFQETVTYITSKSGTEFDPELVEILLKIIKYT